MTVCKRDDGSEVDVEYVVEEHGYPSNGWDDAGAGTIVSITHAYDDDGNDVAGEMSDAERERIEQEIGQSIDEDPHYGDEDYD